MPVPNANKQCINVYKQETINKICQLCIAVRLEELVDNYVEKTVKFVYVHWVGEGVPFSKKGKFGVVHGSVKEHFQVFSVVIYVWLFKTSHVHT